MFQKLSQTLQPPANQPAAAPSTASAHVQLRRTPFSDGSGSIGPPAGWRITGSGGGAVWAAGPNGESVALAVHLQIYDPSWIPYLTADGHRPVPVGATIYRYQGDLVGAWLAAGQQTAQKQHTPIPTFVVTSSNKPADNSVLVVGELDYHDGKGPLVTKLQLGHMGGTGSWGLSVHRLSVPKRLVKEEWGIVTVIKDSLNQDQARLNQLVVEKQAEFSAIGDAATRRAQVEGAAHDAHNQSVYALWDDQNRYSQAFQNYQMDRSPVRDNETGEHRTLDNPTADWLVKLDPNRFEVVNTPEYQPFKDYRPFPAH